jgi:hypothetical protein
MRTKLLKIGLVVLTLVFLAVGGMFAYRFYVPNSASFTFLPSSDRVELIPWISLEFSDETFFKNWHEHSFSGKSGYKIELNESGEAFLRASSQGTSSVLLRQVNIPSSERPFLSWEWKVARFPSNKKNQKLGTKSDNDFSIRVYAIFGGGLPFNSEVIQYVWDDHFPEGTFASGAFSGKTKIFVIQSGSAQPASGWVSEKRDLALDYKELFGKPLKGNFAVVGVMSDSDNTGSQTEAYIRRLQIQKPKDITLFSDSGIQTQSQSGNPIAQLFGTVRNGVQNGVQGGIKTGFKWFETLRTRRNAPLFPQTFFNTGKNQLIKSKANHHN